MKLSKADVEIGRRLKVIRERLLLTQEQAATQIGITKKRFASYEEARVALRYDLALRICRQFIISEKWLATGQGDWRCIMDLSAESVVFVVEVDLSFSAAWQKYLAGVYDEIFKEQGGLFRIIPHGGESDLFIANLFRFILPQWLDVVGPERRGQFLALLMDFGNFVTTQVQRTGELPVLPGIAIEGGMLESLTGERKPTPADHTPSIKRKASRNPKP